MQIHSPDYLLPRYHAHIFLKNGRQGGQNFEIYPVGIPFQGSFFRGQNKQKEKIKIL